MISLRYNLRKGFKILLLNIDKAIFLNKNLKRYEIGDVFINHFDNNNLGIYKNTLCDYDSICLYKKMELDNFVDSIKISLEILETLKLSVVRIRLNNNFFLITYWKV